MYWPGSTCLIWVIAQEAVFQRGLVVSPFNNFIAILRFQPQKRLNRSESFLENCFFDLKLFPCLSSSISIFFSGFVSKMNESWSSTKFVHPWFVSPFTNDDFHRCHWITWNTRDATLSYIKQFLHTTQAAPSQDAWICTYANIQRSANEV